MRFLISKSRVKKYALEKAGERAHKFTRVSSSFYETADVNLRLFIRTHICNLPSKGKTI